MSVSTTSTSTGFIQQSINHVSQFVSENKGLLKKIALVAGIILLAAGVATLTAYTFSHIALASPEIIAGVVMAITGTPLM